MQTENGPGIRKKQFIPLAAGILLLVLVVPVFASTPPLLPSFSISAPGTVDPGSDLPVSVHWEKGEYAYWTVPGVVQVSLYSIPTGERDSTYQMNRILTDTYDRDLKGDYAVVIPTRDIPAGSYMLVALDLESSALARTPVLIPESPGQKTVSPTQSPLQEIFPGTYPDIRLFS
ncbi:MAG: hypothetical protein ABFC24_12050 [Methanoregulaceae archaeon]